MSVYCVLGNSTDLDVFIVSMFAKVLVSVYSVL